jgi:FkbM family methyltransferase
MIVVDLGCYPWRHEVSMEPLIERYHPEVLYGFDPSPSLTEGELNIRGTRVVLERKAAWIEDGEIEFARVRGWRSWDSTVMRAKNRHGEWKNSRLRQVIKVPCFDFSAWVERLPEPPVVKMDVEGAEFPILDHLVARGTDVLIRELLVEWHDETMDGFSEHKERLLEHLRCPVRPWQAERAGRLQELLGLLPRRRVRGPSPR